MIDTDRLILRKWNEDDIPHFAEINSDLKVMEYFPKTLSFEETVSFYNRIADEFKQYGFGLYATVLKSTGEFIGYVGFHHFDFQAEFSPGIEIGWRLGHKHWNRGYATEAAKACLDYARKRRLFSLVYSFTALCNHRSERVMQKIGMQPMGRFQHPALPDGHHLKDHILYNIEL